MACAAVLMTAVLACALYCFQCAVCVSFSQMLANPAARVSTEAWSLCAPRLERSAISKAISAAIIVPFYGARFAPNYKCLTKSKPLSH